MSDLKLFHVYPTRFVLIAQKNSEYQDSGSRNAANINRVTAIHLFSNFFMQFVDRPHIRIF
jgi:hypothetical protein